MMSFDGQPAELVRDETTKPAPTGYPSLLPTLQTVVGMVINNALPLQRTPHFPSLSEEESELLAFRAAALRARSFCQADLKQSEDESTLVANFKACVLPVFKENLLDYIRHGKRIDTEQAVAMVIGYLDQSVATATGLAQDRGEDFEGNETPVIDELLNDPGTIDMLTRTCMWREPKDYMLLDDPREASVVLKKNKILRLLGEPADRDPIGPCSPAFTTFLQTLRRKRNKLDNSQHLVFPEHLLPELQSEHQHPWTLDNSYRVPGTQSCPVPIGSPRIISKILFRKIQRLLYRMRTPSNLTSAYVYDVECFIKHSGSLSTHRLAALESSEDPHAIAYSFIAAQRRHQLKVVSDQGWSRFLVRGEGKLLLQNRPDVLTSFEDVLVRRATDLVALTAVACPEGIRDHFSSKGDILERTRGVCELMERYVRDFALEGKTDKLVFRKDVRGGSGRGPVDQYNKLCDELRDCSARAKAAGMELNIGPVYKFLAKDIMSWNNAWEDDAFAGGKLPGWVEYLARVRVEEINLDD